MQPEPNIDETLAQRGNRYGVFAEHARITQAMKAAAVDSPNWASLAPDQKEAIEMIAHKLGRILNGDPNYHDSWHDIVGYTKLVADRLLQETETTDAETDQHAAIAQHAAELATEPNTAGSEPDGIATGEASRNVLVKCLTGKATLPLMGKRPVAPHPEI